MAFSFVKICSFLLVNLATDISAQKLQLLHVLSANRFYAPEYYYESSELVIPKNLSYEYFLKNSWDVPNSVKMDLFKLGEFLRKTYGNHIDSLYEDEAMKMRTTEFPVSIVAGELINAGLWPPVDLQVWKNDLLWQPIPFSYHQASKDPVLLGTHCPTFKAELKKVLSSHNVTSSHQKLLDDINKKGQVRVDNPIEASLLYLALENSLEANQYHPDWLKDIYPSQNFLNLTLSAYDLMSHTPIQRRLNGGAFLKTIINDSKNYKVGKLNNKRMINIYSGDERNLAGLMKIFDVPMTELPHAGAALIFELSMNTTGYYMKVLYHPGTSDSMKEHPLGIKLPKCDLLCPLDKFAELLADVLPADESSLCTNVTDSANSYLISHPLLVASFFIVNFVAVKIF